MWINRPPGLPLPVEDDVVNNYDYVKKYENWFEEIGRRGLFEELNLDREDYERFKGVGPDKYQIESYITELFWGVRLFELLIDMHDKIIGIGDLMEFLRRCREEEGFGRENEKYLKEGWRGRGRGRERENSKEVWRERGEEKYKEITQR